MKRTTMLGAAAAAAVLAAPASALADGASVIAGPVKVKGYDVSLTATDGGASDSLGVLAVKRSGNSTQMHSWSFTGGVSVSVKGAKATIKGSLGRYGSINASVNAARKTRGTVPAGCKGAAGSVRAGKLAGKTKLVLDTTFFKTVAPKSLNAQISQSGKLDCSGNAGGTPTSGLMLTASRNGDGGQLMLNIIKTGSAVTQQVMRMDPAAATAPASVMHLISSQTGAAGLDAAADLSKATAAGVAPFLSGTLSFEGEAMGGMATGPLSGDFAAKFDSIGTQSLPAGTDAMLMAR
jgi:hypothetical protein